jgi:glycosyltransferase involved in cell wall biosynthesis
VKGLLSLVAAWARLRPAGWRVHIVGTDEDGHKAQVEAAIHAHRLQADFTFLPMIDGEAKWSLYQQSDLFVLPTFSENFGITVAEALACERPVITTKGAPWAELQTHRCGWWVDIGIDPLAAALREALGASDDDRAQMGHRGAQLIAQRYSLPDIARQMRQVYDWTIGHGAMPSCVSLLAA